MAEGWFQGLHAGQLLAAPSPGETSRGRHTVPKIEVGEQGCIGYPLAKFGPSEHLLWVIRRHGPSADVRNESESDIEPRAQCREEMGNTIGCRLWVKGDVALHYSACPLLCSKR